MLYFYLHQVCCGRCLQVSTETRVDRQELGLVGIISMQQLLGSSSQQQGDAHRAVPPPASRGGVVGLRRRFPGLLRWRRLTAPVHVRHHLRPASLSRVQRVEQVSDRPHRAAHPRPPRGNRLSGLTVQLIEHRDTEGAEQTDYSLIWLPFCPITNAV